MRPGMRARGARSCLDVMSGLTCPRVLTASLSACAGTHTGASLATWGCTRAPRYREPEVPMNENIRADELRVVGEEKEALGLMSKDDALAKARAAGLDLVLIVPDAKPPVARVMDYGKFKYEKEKRDKAAKKLAKAMSVELKELKMRYNIDIHDYNVRMKQAKQFLEAGDKVKLTTQFRGREMAFQNLGREMHYKFFDDLGDLAVVEQEARMEGNRMVSVLNPAAKKSEIVKEREERIAKEKKCVLARARQRRDSA